MFFVFILLSLSLKFITYKQNQSFDSDSEFSKTRKDFLSMVITLRCYVAICTISNILHLDDSLFHFNWPIFGTFKRLSLQHIWHLPKRNGCPIWNFNKELFIWSLAQILLLNLTSNPVLRSFSNSMVDVRETKNILLI